MGLVAIVALAVLASSCVSLPGGQSGSADTTELEVPRDDNGVETWDLRRPPTASEVGLAVENDEAIYSSLEPRPVRILLPDGRELEADVTTVSFDNHLSDAGAVAPSSLIMHGANQPFDDALDDLAGSLDQLGLPDDTADIWREAAASSDEEAVRGGASKILGYMEVGVGGRYKSLSDNASLMWTMGWSETTMDRARSEASTTPSPAAS